MRDKLYNVRVSYTHLSGPTLFLCFVALALRVQFASLGHRSFDHSKVLASFSKPSCIIFDVERDWVNPSYADSIASVQQSNGKTYHPEIVREAGLLPSRASITFRSPCWYS